MWTNDCNTTRAFPETKTSYLGIYSSYLAARAVPKEEGTFQGPKSHVPLHVVSLS